MGGEASEELEGIEAVKRLLRVAVQRSGQSRRVADFLLAWYNAGDNGGWDPSDLWSVDPALADDMLRVLKLVRRHSGKYPNDLGFRDEIVAVWHMWRENRPAAEVDEG